MVKKSNAQISRMKRRAEARGEEYDAPPPPTELVQKQGDDPKLAIAVKLHNVLESIGLNQSIKAKDRRSAKKKAEAIAAEEAGCSAEELLDWYEKNKKESGTSDRASISSDKHFESKYKAAAKLQKQLDHISNDEAMKAKDRRSAKRKAEAVASEEAKCSATELLEWYQQNADARVKKNDVDTESKPAEAKHSNPYIAFVGQLSYKTTRDGLFQHIKKELGKEHTVTEETVRIRLLTDAKTKKSRGMAFVETTDPELLYALLKLHLTELDGRRMNIERTAGGKSNSDARKSKIAQYRKEQDEYMGETVEKMLGDYRSSGELDENELDDGVIALCKRHSATIVETALKEYIEAKGRHLENPSAYLTFIIGRISLEGVENSSKPSTSGAKFGRESSDRGRKRPQPSNNEESAKGTVGNKLVKMSEFSKKGVDMSISDPKGKSGGGLSRIFPSMTSRGRGRGAYM